MTLGAGYLPIKQYGNGSTVEFSFDFILVSDGSLVVSKTDADGVTTILTLTTDYTYETNISGGVVTLAVAPTAEEYITIYRDTPKTQGAEYSTSAGFQGKVIENSFDKPTAMIQEISDDVRRALKSPIGTAEEFSLPTPESGKALIWNDTATDLTNSELSINDLDEALAQAEEYADAASLSATAAASSATASATSADEAEASALLAQSYAESIDPDQFHWQSNGVVTLPTYTDNGDGSITINANGVYNFFRSATATDGLIQDTVDTAATFTLTNRAISYVYAYYNDGVPAYAVTTSPLTLFTDGRNVAIYRISRYDTVLRIMDYDQFGVALANKMYFKDVYLNGYQRKSGLVLSTAATRISTITAGEIWFGVTRILTSINTAGSLGSLYEIYPTAGVFDRYLVTEYDATYYSDQTNRLTLGTNKWVCKYFYISAATGNNAYFMHGAQFNTVAQAIEEAVPTPPDIIASHCIYVGKIVIQQGSTNGTAYPRDWAGTVGSGAVTNHDDLAGINLAASGITYGHINSDAQTIAGVKTFSSSPIVPTPTTDMQTATKKYVDDNAGGSGLPLFAPLFLDYIPTDAAYVLADGSSYVSGTVYSTAYAHLLADYNAASDTTETVGGVTVTYRRAADGHKIISSANIANYTSVLSATGTAWYYVLDTTNTRFMLPYTGFFIQGGATTYGAMAAYQSAGLPDINGVLNRILNDAGSSSGAFTASSTVSSILNTGSAKSYSTFTFAASSSNSIYGSSTTVQPKANKLGLYFVCGNSVTNTYLIDAAGLASKDLDDLSTAGKVMAGMGFGTCSTATNAATLTGTVTATYDSATVTGTSTLFTTELAVGNTIIINGSPCYVSAIASNTSLTISVVYNNTTGTYTAYRANSAKAVTITGLTITAGVRIKVVMTNQNLSYTPTLNANSTSDDAIYDEGGNLVSNSFPAFFPAGATVEFYRNAANTAWIYKNTLVTHYKLGRTWYKLHTNGWKVMGGNTANGANASLIITLPTNFLDKSYTTQLTIQWYLVATAQYQWFGTYNKYVNQFEIFNANQTVGGYGANWIAEGF